MGMEARALFLFCGPFQEGSNSDLQTLVFMKLNDLHGSATEAATSCCLSNIWRTGKSTAGLGRSHSDPFNNSHSLVEKPMALACFDTTPHPAKSSAKHSPFTRGGEDCLLSEGRGRTPDMRRHSFDPCLQNAWVLGVDLSEADTLLVPNDGPCRLPLSAFLDHEERTFLDCAVVAGSAVATLVGENLDTQALGRDLELPDQDWASEIPSRAAVVLHMLNLPHLDHPLRPLRMQDDAVVGLPDFAP